MDTVLGRLILICLDTDGHDEDLIPIFRNAQVVGVQPLNILCLKAKLSEALRIDEIREAAIRFLKEEVLPVDHLHFLEWNPCVFQTALSHHIPDNDAFPFVHVSRTSCQIQMEGIPKVQLGSKFEGAIACFMVALERGFIRIRFIFTDTPSTMTDIEYLETFYEEIDKLLISSGKSLDFFNKTQMRSEELRVVFWRRQEHRADSQIEANQHLIPVGLLRPYFLQNQRHFLRALPAQGGIRFANWPQNLPRGLRHLPQLQDQLQQPQPQPEPEQRQTQRRGLFSCFRFW